MYEQELLERLPGIFAQGDGVLVGPGDDCAVLDFGRDKLFLLATDQVLQSVHYPEGTPPAKIAVKLLRRNISDIAAMGGKPAHALLSMSVIGERDGRWLRAFFDATAREARAWGVSVCGGDVCRTLGATDNFCLSISGWVSRDCLCLRSGAADGDLLFATGSFGNSLGSGHHLRFIPRVTEAAFLAGAFTKTMIDVSDGLLLDAARLSGASGLGVSLDVAAVPSRRGSDRSGMLSDGEDYELLAAVRPDKAEELLASWPFKTRLTRIGQFLKSHPGGTVMDSRSKAILCRIGGHRRSSSATAGFDHFRH
ncbi:MAG: thiamine-monophosphate kinase [Victivallales bacterium]|nr:thiamine-monophosphate kinase [Victivallales bacterium]